MYNKGEFHKSLSRGEKTVETSCAYNKKNPSFIQPTPYNSLVWKIKVMVIYAKILQKESKLAASLYMAKQLNDSIGKSQMIRKED